MNIGKSKKDKRILHWQEIKSRVRTHEREFLSGKKGEDYKKKYSEKYLGRDLSRSTNFDKPEYQKELART